MTNYRPKLISIKGDDPGKKVAIFCGVHGDEKAGVMTIDHLKDNLKISAGEVVLVYANTEAIANNTRFVNQNLNRIFIRDKTHESYEDDVANELMDLLDTCDALLDLHAYNERLGGSTPFLICENRCFDLARKLNFTIVASGFNEMEEGGTDSYMSKNGKIGICAELGAIEEPEKFVDLGIKTAYQFLQYFDLIEPKHNYSSADQAYIKADYIYKRKSEDFVFQKQFKTFDIVNKGEVIATENGKELVAPYTGRILFPQPNYPIGNEAFLLASNQTTNSNSQ